MAQNNKRRAPINLANFLNSPSGASIGGIDAGVDYVIDEMASRYGVDLLASLEKATGTRTITACRVKAQDIVFINDFRGLKKDLYFAIDPNEVKGNEEIKAPNITVNSFNGAVVGEKIQAFGFLKSALDSFKEDVVNGKTEFNSVLREEAEKRKRERQKEQERSERIQRENAIKEQKEKQQNIAYSLSLWKQGSPKQNSNSPYFQKKGMSDIHELVFIKEGSEYIASKQRDVKMDMIPLTDIHGNFKSYQKITEDGEKLLAKGPDPKGAFYVLGGSSLNMKKALEDLHDASRIHFSEGLATSYACYKSQGEPMVFCLNAKNLEDVVALFRERYPEKEFVIAADNDKYKPHSGNAGMTSAIKAGITHGALVTYPDFDAEDDDKRLTDWDDFAKLYGPDRMASSYLSEDNTLDLRGIKPENKEKHIQLGIVKHSDVNRAWDHIDAFLLPNGFKTSPKSFMSRFKILSEHAPDNAFRNIHMRRQYEKGDPRRFYVEELPGERLFKLPLRTLVEDGHNISRKMDEKSQAFFNDKMSNYIDANKDVLMELVSRTPINNETFEKKNCTTEETKKILSSQTLGKGQKAHFISETPIASFVTDNFYIEQLAVNPESNKIDNCKGINREGRGVKVSVELSHLQHYIQEWTAQGDGKSKLKSIAKCERSKTISKDFTLESLTINNQRIGVSKVSDEMKKNIARFMLKDSPNEQEQTIDKIKYNDQFALRTISVMEDSVSPKKKVNYSSPSP